MAIKIMIMEDIKGWIAALETGIRALLRDAAAPGSDRHVLDRRTPNRGNVTRFGIAAHSAAGCGRAQARCLSDVCATHSFPAHPARFTGFG